VVVPDPGAAYVVSLGAELLANDKPLHVRFEGRHLFPVLRYYSERDVLGVGHDTRADFKAIEASERFRDGAGNRMCLAVDPPWAARDHHHGVHCAAG
jgi:ABC-type microcin C transport system permease subunit YejE